jgi:serine/threonine protein kinase
MWICPECRQIYEAPTHRCERDAAPVAEVFAHQTKSRYPLLGRIVGDRYHLIGGLGQGGLGTVYLAQHRHLGQLFAVKFLELQSIGAGSDIDDGQKAGYRRDFLKEAQVASLVRHPSVVRVTDFGEHEGMPFLVMEYVPGPSLLQMLGSRGRFPVAEAVAIGRRIAEALDAFHERRLVHRDLKPANVILDPRGDGRLTLVDLGLVKDLSGIGAKASTHPLALRGTPGYLAPEQVPPWVLAQQGVKSTNEKRIVDARVDLYALGVIFYEMLAGVSPYPDGSNTAVIVYACTRDPIPFSSVEPPLRIPAALEALVYDTMHRDPERRPSSAAAFLARLDEATMGQAVQGSWPAIVAPGVWRAPDAAASAPAAAQVDNTSRLDALDPLDGLDGDGAHAHADDGHDSTGADPDEVLESTAVFSEVDLPSGPGPASAPTPKGQTPESPAASGERRHGTGPLAAGAARHVLAAVQAQPDRTLEADVLDPDDLPEALGAGGTPSLPELDDRTRERPSPAGAARVPDSADFDAEVKTQVERAPTEPRTAPPERERLAAARTGVTSAARTDPPAESRGLWRIPVAIGLVSAAAATGWFFARQADAPPDPEVHVVRIGRADAGPMPGSGPTAEPGPRPTTRPPEVDAQPPAPPTRPEPPATASPTGALPVRAPVPPASNAPANPTLPPARRPTGGLEQLLAEGDAAAKAGDLVTAIARYEAFMKRAGEAHPHYYVIQSRVEGLRAKLPPR